MQNRAPPQKIVGEAEIDAMEITVERAGKGYQCQTGESKVVLLRGRTLRLWKDLSKSPYTILAC
jgi:hypothetical protein